MNNEQVRAAALEQVAALMAGKEDGVWANTCAAGIRALASNTTNSDSKFSSNCAAPERSGESADAGPVEAEYSDYMNWCVANGKKSMLFSHFKAAWTETDPAAHSSAPSEATQAQFDEWCERHDMRQHLHREAFDDAASLYLTVPRRAALAAPTGDTSAPSDYATMLKYAVLRDSLTEIREWALYALQDGRTAEAEARGQFHRIVEAGTYALSKANAIPIALAAPTGESLPFQGVPEELSKAFITLEGTGNVGRNIVLKFNHRSDAYAVHDFLLKAAAPTGASK